MIDYEAALDAFVVAQAQVTNGVYHPKTGQLIMEAMIRAVVAAALGDTVLYRGCEHEVNETLCNVMCEAYVRGDGMVQVWPEEASNEG